MHQTQAITEVPHSQVAAHPLPPLRSEALDPAGQKSLWVYSTDEYTRPRLWGTLTQHPDWKAESRMITPEVLFGPTGQIAWGQECARAVVIFGYGLVLVRIAGRRIFANWAALDTIVSIVIGSSLSRALTG